MKPEEVTDMKPSILWLKMHFMGRKTSKLKTRKYYEKIYSRLGDKRTW